MMRKLAGMLSLGAMLVVPVAANAMSVSDFLAKADALKARGFLAIGSPDIALLKGEVAAASKQYRDGLAAEIAAGRKPSSCPPPKGTAKISSDDLLASFRAIPPAQRRASVAAAFAAMMKKRYPCPNASVS